MDPRPRPRPASARRPRGPRPRPRSPSAAVSRGARKHHEFPRRMDDSGRLPGAPAPPDWPRTPPGIAKAAAPICPGAARVLPPIPPPNPRNFSGFPGKRPPVWEPPSDPKKTSGISQKYPGIDPPFLRLTLECSVLTLRCSVLTWTQTGSPNRVPKQGPQTASSNRVPKQVQIIEIQGNPWKYRIPCYPLSKGSRSLRFQHFGAKVADFAQPRHWLYNMDTLG